MSQLVKISLLMQPKVALLFILETYQLVKYRDPSYGTKTNTINGNYNPIIDLLSLQPAHTNGKVAAINAAIEAANTDVDLGTSIQNGIPIYTIGLGENSDNFTLQRIADETDGTYHFSPTTAELDQIFQDIVEEIRTGLADYSLDEQVP